MLSQKIMVSPSTFQQPTLRDASSMADLPPTFKKNASLTSQCQEFSALGDGQPGSDQKQSSIDQFDLTSSNVFENMRFAGAQARKISASGPPPSYPNITSSVQRVRTSSGGNSMDGHSTQGL